MTNEQNSKVIILNTIKESKMKSENLEKVAEVESDLKSDNLENEKVKNEKKENDIYKLIQSISDCV
jgi:hypothetical protein